jgi:hypothetical protein
MNETENNPVDQELSAPEPAQEPSDIATDADQAEETSDDSQEPQEEFEEVEYEGKRYAVPKELKDAVLRQADYTRKTQELAQTRQQAEAEIASKTARIEAERANIQTVARLTAMDERLQQYQGVDWQQLSQTDPVRAQQEFFQYQQLKDSRQQFVFQVQQHESQRAMQEQQETAQRMQQANDALKREISNWSPDYARELRSVAKELGADESELDGIKAPWIVKALHAQKVLSEMTKKAGAPAPQPAPKPIRTISGGNAKGVVDPDRMSTADWMRMENARVAKMRGR